MLADVRLVADTNVSHGLAYDRRSDTEPWDAVDDVHVPLPAASPGGRKALSQEVRSPRRPGSR
jgi:hypothetical protein